jgi:predicted PurR-regulated permease PerM
VRGAVAVQLESKPESKAEPRWVTGALRFPLGLVTFIVVVAALWTAKAVLIPLAMAALASCGLRPIHDALVRLRIPRNVSAAAVVSGVVVLLAGSALALQTPAANFVSRLPAITQQLRNTLNQGRALQSTVQPVQQAANELKKATETEPPPPEKGVTRVRVEDPPLRLSDLLWRGTMNVMEFAVQATMVIFLVFYLLASGDRYKEKLMAMAGPSVFRKHLTLEIINRIVEQVERFLIARVIISLIVTIATGAALALLGVSQWVIWSLAAGLLNNIPYLGPTVAVTAIAFAALAQFGTLEMVLAAGGAAGAIAFVEGFVLTPWIMGRAGRMNAGVVFVSLMFWGWIWGTWGMLLAVPIMMAVKAVCDHVEKFRPVSELLSD